MLVDKTIYSRLLGKQIRMHGIAPEVEDNWNKVLDDEGSGQTSWVIEGIELQYMLEQMLLI